MGKIANSLTSHWKEALTGGVTGAIVAWSVMVISQLSGNANSLIINSDVIGAAIGAFLAIAGAYGIEMTRRRSTVKTAKRLAQDTARHLVKSLMDYDNYMRAYRYSDENGILNGEIKIRIYESADRAQAIVQILERSAITFDTAANLALIGDVTAMIPIAHLSRSVKSGMDGLTEIPKIKTIDGKKNLKIYDLYEKSLLERMRMIPDLNEYAANMRLWLPQYSADVRQTET